MQEKIVGFIRDFIVGIKSIYQAVFFIFKHWLWLYFLLPVVLSIGLLFGGDFLLSELRNVNIQEDLSTLDFQKSFEDFSFRRTFEFTQSEVSLLLIGVKLVLMLLLFKMTKYFVLVLLSPILTLASVQVEKIVTGNSYPFSWTKFVEDVYRAILFSFRNMMVQVFFIICWHLATFIYVDLKYGTSFFIFLIGAYYYGAALMDYTNERRRLSMQDSMEFVKQNKGTTMAIGGMFSALFFIDYIGVVIAPVWGIVAGTLAVHYKVDLSKNKYAEKGLSWEEKKKQKSKENKTITTISNSSLKSILNKGVKKARKKEKDNTDW